MKLLPIVISQPWLQLFTSAVAKNGGSEAAACNITSECKDIPRVPPSMPTDAICSLSAGKLHSSEWSKLMGERTSASHQYHFQLKDTLQGFALKAIEIGKILGCWRQLPFSQAPPPMSWSPPPDIHLETLSMLSLLRILRILLVLQAIPITKSQLPEFHGEEGMMPVVQVLIELCANNDNTFGVCCLISKLSNLLDPVWFYPPDLKRFFKTYYLKQSSR